LPSKIKRMSDNCPRESYLSSGASSHYAPDMALRAADVASAIRSRMADVPTKKLHKLLYYCQGHHLAVTGEPLFTESVSAWDMGPVVGQLWHQERSGHPLASGAQLNEAALNTIGYVLSRYGRLTGRDLEHLTHSEMPWERANVHRPPSGRVRIEEAWMREYFAADVDEEDPGLDTAVVTDWLQDAEHRRSDELHVDSYEDLRARLSDAS
jgi:uncharacterized phage-associated protein